MAKFKGKWRIESARLQTWDYGWNGRYFITICTANRQCFFGDIRDKQMYLSETGHLARKFWYEIPAHFPFVLLDAFIVMPNHIHGIVIIDRKINVNNGNDDHRVSGNDIDDVHDNGNDNRNENNGNNDNGVVETRQCLVSTGPPNPSNHTDPTNDSDTINPPDPIDPISNAADISDTDKSTTNSNGPSALTPGQKRLRNQGKNTLSSFIGSYKSIVTRNAHKIIPEFRWQSRFHDHIIRDDESYERIRQYILNNPKNWKNDRFY